MINVIRISYSRHIFRAKRFSSDLFDCPLLFRKQRSVHTSRQTFLKLFRDRENQHAHNVLKGSSGYNISPEIKLDSGVTAIPDDILRNPPKDATVLINAFQSVVEYCRATENPISKEIFDHFVDSLVNVSNQLTDDQLLRCLSLLQQLPASPGVNSRNFIELWKAFDHACLENLQRWTVDEILRYCDCWYQLNLGKCSEFVWNGIKKIGRKPRKLTPSQFTHTVFLCNIVRKPLVDMFELELRFDELVDQLSTNEIGIVCAGFFKTQTKIHSAALLSKIYRRLIDNLDSVEDITLVNYLKILRYCSKLGQAGIMSELLEQLCPHIDRISLLACLHVALTGCDIQMCHKKCIELILKRFVGEIENARIKDMERITHVISLYNIQLKSGIEKELCEKIISELPNRVDEIVQYPKCFHACLHYLSLCGYHDTEMTNVALDQRFIRHVYGSNQLLGREVFCLDSFARINLHHSYDGNLLSIKQRKTMGKLFTHYIPEKNSKFRLNVTDRILVEVNECCANLYGVSSIKHILPHFERPDIIIVYDTAARAGIALNELCPADYSGQILSKADTVGNGRENYQTSVVVVGGWNSFVRHTNNPTGLLDMKLKQLIMLGYFTALVPWYEWREQETITDKHNYLKRKLLLFATPTKYVNQNESGRSRPDISQNTLKNPP